MDGDDNDGPADSSSGPVIDLDKLHNFIWQFLNQNIVSQETGQNLVEIILEHSNAIPNLVKLPVAVYGVIDRLLDNSFTCINTLI